MQRRTGTQGAVPSRADRAAAEPAVRSDPAESVVHPDRHSRGAIAAEHPDLDRFCLILQRAGRAWRRQSDEALRAYNLSEATTTPLWLISRLGDGLRQRRLADHLGIEGQSLVRLIDHLEGAGYVVRRDDPKDRRAKTLHLTLEGRAVVDRVDAVIDEVRLQLLAGVSPEELETTARVLDAIIMAADTPS